MLQSKLMVSQALSLLKSNMTRTGDPLGLRNCYWKDWVEELDLPQSGTTVLLTARMYQMLPYFLVMSKMISRAKPFIPLFSLPGVGKLTELANQIAGEYVIRFQAGGFKEIKSQSKKVLKGIVNALGLIGESPAYLYEKEPYSGVLLYDLGLEDFATDHITRIGRQLKENGIERIITVDPHTTHILKLMFSRYPADFDFSVMHYLELLSQKSELLKPVHCQHLPKQVVIHDSCVMTRELNIADPTRSVIKQLGIEIREPENTRENTACCGGPVEYAFTDLSDKISNIRIKELAEDCKDVLVTCPICYINLRKYEKEYGIKVWDMGELLFDAL